MGNKDYKIDKTKVAKFNYVDSYNASYWNGKPRKKIDIKAVGLNEADYDDYLKYKDSEDYKVDMDKRNPINKIDYYITSGSIESDIRADIDNFKKIYPNSNFSKRSQDDIYKEIVNQMNVQRSTSFSAYNMSAERVVKYGRFTIRNPDDNFLRFLSENEKAARDSFVNKTNSDPYIVIGDINLGADFKDSAVKLSDVAKSYSILLNDYYLKNKDKCTDETIDYNMFLESRNDIIYNESPFANIRYYQQHNVTDAEIYTDIDRFLEENPHFFDGDIFTIGVLGKPTREDILKAIRKKMSTSFYFSSDADLQVSASKTYNWETADMEKRQTNLSWASYWKITDKGDYVGEKRDVYKLENLKGKIKDKTYTDFEKKEKKINKTSYFIEQLTKLRSFYANASDLVSSHEGATFTFYPGGTVTTDGNMGLAVNLFLGGNYVERGYEIDDKVKPMFIVDKSSTMKDNYTKDDNGTYRVKGTYLDDFVKQQINELDAQIDNLTANTMKEKIELHTQKHAALKSSFVWKITISQGFSDFYADKKNVDLLDKLKNVKKDSEEYDSYKKKYNLDDAFFENMLPEEQTVYFYLQQTDQKKAKEYLEILQEEITYRRAYEAAAKDVDKWTQDPNGFKYLGIAVKGNLEGLSDIIKNITALAGQKDVSEYTEDDWKNIIFIQMLNAKNPAMAQLYELGKGLPKVGIPYAAGAITLLTTKNPILAKGAIAVTHAIITAGEKYNYAQKKGYSIFESTLWAYTSGGIEGVTTFVTQYCNESIVNGVLSYITTTTFTKVFSVALNGFVDKICFGDDIDLNLPKEIILAAVSGIVMGTVLYGIDTLKLTNGKSFIITKQEREALKKILEKDPKIIGQGTLLWTAIKNEAKLKNLAKFLSDENPYLAEMI